MSTSVLACLCVWLCQNMCYCKFNKLLSFLKSLQVPHKVKVCVDVFVVLLTHTCWCTSAELIKVWWHSTFSSPAVSMLLSNSGLVDQLQTVLSSSSSSAAPSLSPSAGPPSALLCCSHLLVSSLITLQHVHSTQVHAAQLALITTSG